MIATKAAAEPTPVQETPEPKSSWWVSLGIAGVAFVVAFWPILLSLSGSWFDDRAYTEHGVLVVPAAAYMVWTKAGRLKRIPRRPSGWGVALIACGALQAIFGLAAQWVWVTRAAVIVSVVGCVLALYGWRFVRELAYPLCTLLLMIPPPTFIYNKLTLDLQLLASRLGEIFLEALGYSVMREGNILHLVGITLSVEEACSGIRSLLSIFFMCVLYNFIFVRGNGTRAVILAMSVPIAILGNACRILGTGIASQYNRAWTEGMTHEMFGYISVVVGGIGCILVHVLILQIRRVWRHEHA